ncbi:MAG: helix-turn-helix transcriptional regulator [Clostridia bacterium]|nr:helix-turn-helix transcriptional regulator [Clostridia bacterium]
MEEKIQLPPRSEYSVTAENVTLRLMLDRETVIVTDDELMRLITMHTHAYAELFICTEGSITLITQNGEVRLSAGELAIIPAELPHYKAAVNNDGTWYSVGILPIRRHSRGCRNLYRSIAGLCYADEVSIIRRRQDICRAVADIAVSEYPTDSCIPALDMMRLLLKLGESDTIRRTASEPPPSGGEINRIAQLEHILDAHFTHDLTIEATAAQLFISPRQLTRIVKQRYGMTLHRTLLKKRVTAAARLLRESNIFAEKVGFDVGFKSKSCFYRAFREEYGMTPLEYRVHALEHREHGCDKEDEK